MSDGLSWAAAIDTTKFEDGMRRIMDEIQNTASNVEFESEKIQALFSDIPEIDIKAITNLPETADEIQAAYAEISQAQKINGDAIKELEAEYSRLSEQIKRYESVPSKRDEVNKWRDEQKAINANIMLRKELIAKTNELTGVVQKNEQAFKKQAQTQGNLKTRIREVMMEMASMRNEAQMNGREIDESTGRYRELAEELGRLKDIQGDVATQAKILSSDDNKFQGILSGLSGLSGGFTAAQGAMALFGSENENLQKVMTQLQAVMAITMGLQQMQNVLNKDSAFRLVTLNSLRALWNKLMGQSNAATAVNNAETATNASVTAAQATATEQETAAEVANTAAQTANNTATRTNTSETVGNTAATEGATTATNAHTGAMVAGTAATKAMSVAMRVLKLALVSTGIGALIVLVGELVSWITDLIGKESEAVKHTKELNAVNEEAAKTYIQEKVALDDNIRACRKLKGTKEQEKKKVEELNSTYGEALGYYDSLEQWEKVLMDRGPAYCKLQQLKAERQGLLNKYVESYIELLAVQHKAENGDYDAWYRTKAGDLANREKEIEKQRKLTEQWEAELKKQDTIIEKYQADNNFEEIHIDPNRSGKLNGNGSGKAFDPKAAARQQKEALKQWKDAVTNYIKAANAEVNQASIDAMEEGMAKELRTIQAQTEQKTNAWKQQLLHLAEARMVSEKAYYLSKKGNTEEGWENSARGKMSVQDYADEFLASPENQAVAVQYYDRLNQITENGEKQLSNIRKKYSDKWIKEYGSDLQKAELLQEEWNARLQKVMIEAPEMYEAVLAAIEREEASLDLSKFKLSINWDEVFGDLDEQSLQSLHASLDKVKTYFTKAKGDMTVTEIKDFQEAIAKMEDEIASRNPFTAMHKALKDISSSKTEFTSAMEEWKVAQREHTSAVEEYNEALRAKNEIIDAIDNEELTQNSEELAQAEERLIASRQKAYTAAEKESRSEQRVMTARNNITASYKRFASSLGAVGNVIRDVGGNAKKLASVFSDSVGSAIEKAIDLTDEVLDATGSVINAIGDLGNGVAKGVETAVEATSQGAAAAAATGATAISTIEKASVILTVISAAMQVATAIANLFNSDDKKQREIEALQERLDQLQWELDNADAVRLRNNMGDAVARLRDLYRETTAEVLKLHGLTTKSPMVQWLGQVIFSSEIYEKSVQKIADAYANVSYAADKALGSKRYDESRKQLENLAQQQILIQKQIQEENSKKKTDSGKVQDMKNQIAEIAEDMASIINDMLEDVIGHSAEDLAKTLGDAFFDAVSQGEDAMQAWAKTTKGLVRDILKQMVVTEFLEQRIGDIFDKYKAKWFKDGVFQGAQSVLDSADALSNDIDNVGREFSSVWESLSSSLGKWFEEDSEREGVGKGIANASQDSVDENNARLTTIQGHTYTLVQGVTELNGTANAMLERLTGIETNTSEANEKLDSLNTRIKRVGDTLDTIQTNGLRLK